MGAPSIPGPVVSLTASLSYRDPSPCFRLSLIPLGRQQDDASRVQFCPELSPAHLLPFAAVFGHFEITVCHLSTSHVYNLHEE